MPSGERKPFLLRLDPEVYSALHRWADDELRSVNAQIDFLLRKALKDAGRSPKKRAGGSARSANSPSTPDDL
jgi:hypothetical protein